MSTAYTVGSHLYISHSVTLWWWNYIKIQYKLKIKGVFVKICLCSRIYYCCYFISTIIQRKFLDFKKEKLKPIIVNEEPIKIRFTLFSLFIFDVRKNRMQNYFSELYFQLFFYIVWLKRYWKIMELYYINIIKMFWVVFITAFLVQSVLCAEWSP